MLTPASVKLFPQPLPDIIMTASHSTQGLFTKIKVHFYAFFAGHIFGSKRKTINSNSVSPAQPANHGTTQPARPADKPRQEDDARPGIDVHGRDLISRLFFYSRDIENMMRFGIHAPTSAELVYVDPNKLERCINQSLANRLDTGCIKAGDWDLITTRVQDERKVQGVKQRILQRLPWTQTECWKVAKKLVRKRPGADGLYSKADIRKRFKKLESFINSVASFRELAFLPRAALLTGNFREASGVIICVARDGRLLFARRGCHRLAIAQSFRLAFIPAQIGIVHEQAVATGCWRKNLLTPAQVAQYLQQNFKTVPPATSTPTASGGDIGHQPRDYGQRIADADDKPSNDFRPKRYGKGTTSGSIEYTKNKRKHWDAQPAENYLRLQPILPGHSVVEVGGAEGILALNIALYKSCIRSIDITAVRHESAVQLKARWLELGQPVSHCEILLGDALNNPGLLDGFDTLLSSRVIYYFGPRIHEFMDNVRTRNKYICLVGNEKRQRLYKKGDMRELGEYAKFATLDGMIELITHHGFVVKDTIASGDPVVVGKRT
jgi:hypothetical protein